MDLWIWYAINIAISHALVLFPWSGSALLLSRFPKLPTSTDLWGTSQTAPFLWRLLEDCWFSHPPSPLEPELSPCPCTASIWMHHCYSCTRSRHSCTVLEGGTPAYSTDLWAPLTCLTQRHAPTGDAVIIANDYLETAGGRCCSKDFT